MANLNSHIKNMQLYGLPIVVAINHFVSDTDKEIQMIKDDCAKQNVEAILTDAWAKGGKGTHDLANKVVELSKKETVLNNIYNLEDFIKMTPLTSGLLISMTFKLMTFKLS